MSPDPTTDESPGPDRPRRYSAEETARRGDMIYEQAIRAQVEPEHVGEVVAIDIESGAWAIAEDALSAARALRAREPDAEVWLVRVGSRFLYRIGVQTG